jgi:CMP/dCMP kinase
MPPRPFIVAIDGPAGAGKSTVSRLVAERLGFAMVDTGAIYRAVALAATRRGIALDDDDGLAALLPSVRIRFAPRAAPGEGQRVLLGDEDVSAEIRTPPMSLGASKVSARPIVRAGLLDLQRRLALAPENAGAVLEGRDIGTVVFPDALLKVYLDADPEVRAQRRSKEVTDLDYETVAADLARRDALDQGRDHSPLQEASDALVVDTTGLSVEEIVDRLAEALDAG